MHVRYFKIFAYVAKIYPLVYDACTHCNKSAHAYVFALNIPYCTCRATHSMQNRFVYFWLFMIVYFVMLLQLNVCITITEFFLQIIGSFSEFYYVISRVLKSSLLFTRMLGSFYIRVLPNWMPMQLRYSFMQCDHLSFVVLLLTNMC